MAKNRVLYLTALAGAAVFHAYHTAWLSWYVLLLLLCLPGLSLLCSLPAVLGARLTAEAPERCVRGQPAELRLRPEGRAPLSRCRFRLTLTDRMAGTAGETRFTAGSGGCTLSLPTGHCGLYAYAFSRGRVTDYLGLFSFPLRLPAPGTLTVEPSPAPMDPEPDLDALRPRAYRPRPGGGFSEVHELREYRPGDPLRDVYWKLSAKTDKLIVREPQSPERRSALVLLDLSGPREAADRALDRLLWLSGRLLELEADYTVRWSDGGAPRSLTVKTRTDERALTAALLGSRLDGAAAEAGALPPADLCLRLNGREAES